MAKTIKLDIVTPEKITFSDDVDSVVIPGAMGKLGVLPGHMPLITALKAGALRYTTNGQQQLLAVSGGFAQIDSEKIVVLAETAEMAEEIDIARAKNKIAEKDASLKQISDMNPEDVEILRASLIKEIVRLKVADRLKNRL